MSLDSNKHVFKRKIVLSVQQLLLEKYLGQERFEYRLCSGKNNFFHGIEIVSIACIFPTEKRDRALPYNPGWPKIQIVLLLLSKYEDPRHVPPQLALFSFFVLKYFYQLYFEIFNVIFFDYLGILHHTSHHTHFPGFSGLTTTLVTYPQTTGQGEELKKYKSNLCCPYAHWSTVKVLVVTPYRKLSPSPPVPPSKAINCRKLHLIILIIILKSLLQWFPV